MQIYCGLDCGPDCRRLLGDLGRISQNVYEHINEILLKLFWSHFDYYNLIRLHSAHVLILQLSCHVKIVTSSGHYLQSKCNISFQELGVEVISPVWKGFQVKVQLCLPAILLYCAEHLYSFDDKWANHAAILSLGAITLHDIYWGDDEKYHMYHILSASPMHSLTMEA